MSHSECSPLDYRLQNGLKLVFFSCVKDVVVGCFIEQINRRGGSLREHVVVQSGVHLVHILHLQSNVQCLRQGCDLDVVTLHGHGLHFVSAEVFDVHLLVNEMPEEVSSVPNEG